jgi:hypothetical protein
VPCIPLLDCEYGIGSVESPAFFFPSSREKLSSLTVLPVKTVAVGEHVQRIDQFEHSPRDEFEQPGIENIRYDDHVKALAFNQVLNVPAAGRIEVAVHRQVQMEGLGGQTEQLPFSTPDAAHRREAAEDVQAILPVMPHELVRRPERLLQMEEMDLVPE